MCSVQVGFTTQRFLKVFFSLTQALLKLKFNPESPAAGSLHISRLGEG